MKVESESESEVAQSCLTLRDPMDCSLPDSSVDGIFQARALEWGDIAVSWFSPNTNKRSMHGLDNNSFADLSQECLWFPLEFY